MADPTKTPHYMKVANEIVNTEVTFVNQMETMILVFVQPLKVTGDKIIPSTTQVSCASRTKIEIIVNDNKKIASRVASLTETER